MCLFFIYFVYVSFAAGTKQWWSKCLPLWKSELAAVLCTEHEIFIKSSHFEKAYLFSDLCQQKRKDETWSFLLVLFQIN